MGYYVSTYEGPGGIVESIVRVDGDHKQWTIPDVPDNADWIAYQEWLAEGNTPEPWPPA